MKVSNKTRRIRSRNNNPFDINRWNDQEANLRDKLKSAMGITSSLYNVSSDVMKLNVSKLRDVQIKQIVALINAVKAVKKAKKFKNGGKVSGDIIEKFYTAEHTNLAELAKKATQAISNKDDTELYRIRKETRNALGLQLIKKHVSDKKLAKFYLGTCMEKLKLVHKNLLIDLENIIDSGDDILILHLQNYMDHIAIRIRGKKSSDVLEHERTLAAFNKPKGKRHHKTECQRKQQRANKQAIQQHCINNSYDPRKDPCATEDPETTAWVYENHGSKQNAA